MQIPKVPLARWSGVEGRPWVLAGPAVAESSDVLDEIARRLENEPVDVLAAAAWGSGEGSIADSMPGTPALAWLRQAASRRGMRCATRVGDARQVAQALEHGIDLLWIDGRTVGDPPGLQVVAHALRGAPVPVLVSNPPLPDAELWAEAIERLAVAGVERLGALHVGLPPTAGAHHSGSSGWDLVIELRRRYPDLPVVCAVSRLPGEREQLRETAQTALDLGLEGLMIEVHPQPEHAWREAQRHVLPERAAAVLAGVKMRRAGSPEVAFNARLAELRGRVDAVDRRLLDVLRERMDVVEQIARLKRSGNVTSLQVERWRSLLEQRSEWAARLGLSRALVQEVYQAIHGESIRRQSEILDCERCPPSDAGSPNPGESES